MNRMGALGIVSRPSLADGDERRLSTSREIIVAVTSWLKEAPMAFRSSATNYTPHPTILITTRRQESRKQTYKVNEGV